MAKDPTYGHYEHNPLPTGYHDEEALLQVDWTDPRLARIERMRFVSDPGFPAWDLSYCFGRLKSGEKVEVLLPFTQLPKRNMFGALIQYAKRDRVYLRGLGVFGAISTLSG